jgi:hypothetical protein
MRRSPAQRQQSVEFESFLFPALKYSRLECFSDGGAKKSLGAFYRFVYVGKRWSQKRLLNSLTFSSMSKSWVMG